MARLRVGPVAEGPEESPHKALQALAHQEGEAAKAAEGVPRSLAPYERQSGNWLSAYLEYTKDGESPDNYHVWAGLSALSSVVRRNVWIDQGLYVLYPNLFVALVGPPARTAKSTAIWLARKILQQIPYVTFGPSACSREQLIRKMAEVKFNNQCCLTIHSSEFSSILDVSGLLMIQFLTDIYDCAYVDKSGWTYETKNKGKDTIIQPYLSMLVGTTPAYIATAMPDNIVGHGFTSRVIFVNEEVERQVVPRPGNLDGELEKSLVNDLKHIGNIYGQFRWDKSGEEAYDDFYRDLYRNIPTDHRLEGYHWRKKVHVLKVAMLLSLAENDSLVLTDREVLAAARLLHSIEAKMARAFSAVGKYEHAIDIERIGNMIRNNPDGMSISDVFRRTYFIASEDELRKILNILCRMGIVRQQLVKGIEWFYPGKGGLPWAPEVQNG